MLRIVIRTLVFTLIAAGCLIAQEQPDCRPVPVINNGVCRDKDGKDCSKDAAERGPRVCEAPEPQYTAEAQRAGIKGTVVLSFRLSQDGCAEDIRVLHGLGYGLDEAAIDALERWRWQRRKKPIDYATSEFTFGRQYPNLKPPTTPKCTEKKSGSPKQQ